MNLRVKTVSNDVINRAGKTASMFSNVYLLLLILSMLASLAACQQQQDTPETDAVEPINTSAATTAAPPSLPSSDVLATVNGENITEQDVEFMIGRTFSSSDRLFDSQQFREKVLQSLIASKAMRQSITKELSTDEQQELQQKIVAYSEELYVKEYLTQHATPDPVTTAMVTDYYEKNLEQFGGGELKSIEILKANNKITETEREQLLTALPAIRQAIDWQKYAQSATLRLSYLRSKVQPKLLEPALEIAAKKLSQGDASDIIFIDSIPHIIRVVAIDKIPAKPLSAVSASIRKKLAALQLKKAVKKASEFAIANAKVERK